MTLKRAIIDKEQLASLFVGSPDPLQSDLPFGQKLILEFRLPSEAMEKKPLHLVLDLLYRDYSQESVTYPITQRQGEVTYVLGGLKYKEKRGFLTYRAQIIGNDKEIIREWEHLFWVDLIPLEALDADLD